MTDEGAVVTPAYRRGVASTVSVLSLAPATLRRTVHDGNVVRHPVSHYLDFHIDGRSLAHQISETAGLVTLLNRPWAATVLQAVEALSGRQPSTDLALGRVMIFACGECGDLSCGAVTAALNVAASVSTWSDFCWEDGGSSALPIAGGPGSATFSTIDYLATLDAAADWVARLPHDEVEHRSRSFLWPWQWGWRLPKR